MKTEEATAKQIRTPRLLNSDAAVLIGAPSGSYVRVMKDRLATVYAKVLFFSTWPFKNEFQPRVSGVIRALRYLRFAGVT